MIVVGLDVHKHSLTAVAVDELGRSLAETRGPVDAQLIEWGCTLGEERLWAVEDCRHVTRGLEQALVAAGERLVRVPPRLTAPQRRRGRTRGKSDEIDALAIARAALQEPSLDGPRPGEQVLHELKLLVDHRDDLVDERRRAQQRLRWHLHELDPNLTVPLGALDRTVWLDRLARLLARREQTIQVRISRELVGRCKTLTRSVLALDRELEQYAQALAPRLLELAGCGPLSAVKLLCEIGPIDRFRTDAQLARHAGVAPLDASSGKSKRHRLDRGGNRQLNCALHRIAVTQGRWHPPARAYLERKQAEGKTRREALRCLKRQLARTVYTTLKNEPPLT
ncbi:MAG TPA: IS110 family transposase [Gaiellaceae bacterium]|nr:IS110 family transposase [Gaiellaceae bacterium]